ncbi:MAG: hypothetical protein ACO2YK_12640 [Paracoccaceae bacterium]
MSESSCMVGLPPPPDPITAILFHLNPIKGLCAEMQQFVNHYRHYLP